MVAQLLQHTHPVRDAPMLDHLAIGEPGHVDDVDADRFAGRRVAELPGAAVRPASQQSGAEQARRELGGPAVVVPLRHLPMH